MSTEYVVVRFDTDEETDTFDSVPVAELVIVDLSFLFLNPKTKIPNPIKMKITYITL
jgi:hypothetical protein